VRDAPTLARAPRKWWPGVRVVDTHAIHSRAGAQDAGFRGDFASVPFDRCGATRSTSKDGHTMSWAQGCPEGIGSRGRPSNYSRLLSRDPVSMRYFVNQTSERI